MSFSHESEGFNPGLFGWLAMIILVLFILTGCAGPSRQGPPGELISHVQTQAKQGAFQEKLLTQVSQSTLKSYKDYKVGPEDLLEVSFFGMDELGREVRVNGRGEITLPLVGPVKVEGSSPAEVEARLMQLYKEGKFIKNPQVTVFIKEYRHQRVMVTGAVISPGSYEMIGPRTLLEMLGKAGGLNDKAGDVIHIIRSQSASGRLSSLKNRELQSFSPGAETIVIDLRRLMVEGDLRLNFPIQNGDAIYVPLARMAFVLGAVKKPGQVPVKDKLTVSQALALVEGTDPMLASNQISILRMDEQGQKITIPIDLKRVTAGKALDPELKENDVVFVEESGIRRFLFNFKNLMPGSVGLSYGLI